MEDALAFYLPDVAVKADVDIQASLDGKNDGISLDEIPALVALAANAPAPATVQDLLGLLHSHPVEQAA